MSCRVALTSAQHVGKYTGVCQYRPHLVRFCACLQFIAVQLMPQTKGSRMPCIFEVSGWARSVFFRCWEALQLLLCTERRVEVPNTAFHLDTKVFLHRAGTVGSVRHKPQGRREGRLASISIFKQLMRSSIMEALSSWMSSMSFGFSFTTGLRWRFENGPQSLSAGHSPL